MQQIDVVPTLTSPWAYLSLPLNDFGRVVQELYWWDYPGNDYAKALDIDARRVPRHMTEYPRGLSSTACGELRRYLILVSTMSGQEKGHRTQSILIVNARDLLLSGNDSTRRI